MKLPRLKPREVEAALKKDGWYGVDGKGGHRHYRHPNKLGKTTIPFSSKDIGPGLLKKILNQTSITPEEFMDLI